MNDKNVLPSPKPSFNKCPKNARTEMSLKEVENYYLSGGGQEYLCNLAKNPLFFGSSQKLDYAAACADRGPDASPAAAGSGR